MGNCCKGSHKIGGGGSGGGSAKKYKKDLESGIIDIGEPGDEIVRGVGGRRKLYYTDGGGSHHHHHTHLRSDLAAHAAVGRPISKFNGELAATNKQFLLHQSNFITNNINDSSSNSNSNIQNYNSVSYSKISHPLINNNKLVNKNKLNDRPVYNQSSSAHDFSTSTNLTSSTHSAAAGVISTLNEFTSENQSIQSSSSQISRDFRDDSTTSVGVGVKKRYKSSGGQNDESSEQLAKKLAKAGHKSGALKGEHTIDEEEVNNLTNSSIIDLCSNKNQQVSLSNSKRNIESIERTIKDSKSIEIWLDQISVEESSAASTRKQQLSKRVHHETKDHDLRVEIKPPLKLVEQCKEIAEFTYSDCEQIESELNQSISESFIYPNSSDDKVFLKWLIGDRNFEIALIQPNVNIKSMRRFVMSPANLNISLEVGDLSTSSSSLSTDSNNKDPLADQTYLTYDSTTKHLLINVSKIELIISKEKGLVEHQPLNNNSMNKERLEEFRSSYIQTPNFVGAQCLMSMMRKKSSPMLLNSSSSSSSSSSTTTTTSNSTSSDMFHKVAYADLEEKLFASFLCKYSCQLSDTFLASKDSIESFGIIRRGGSGSGGDHHSSSTIFSFVLLEKGSKDELCTSTTSLSFGFRLNKWPGEYSTFFQRMRKGQLIAANLLSQLELQSCLITPAVNQDELWTVDTSLAETTLLRSLNKAQIFKFYFYLTMINSLHKFISPSKLSEPIHVDQRVLLHHYFRFLESTSAFQESPLGGVGKSKTNSTKSACLITKEVLLKFCINFNAFIRAQVVKHKTLNKPNFFHLESSILDSDLYNNYKLLEQAFKLFDSFLRAGSVFELSSLSLHHQHHNDLTSSEILKQNSLLNEYVHDFYKVLFGQFKLKQDNFKLKEDMLWDIHDKIIGENGQLKESFDSVVKDKRSLRDGLSRELEYYAEFVHKYLPKVRLHNQYLLFHYVWTMQVQYLAPFFNYMSDLSNSN